jgi:hypothetical protein
MNSFFRGFIHGPPGRRPEDSISRLSPGPSPLGTSLAFENPSACGEPSIPAGMKNYDSNHNLLIYQRSRGMHISTLGSERDFSEVCLFYFFQKSNKSLPQKQPSTRLAKKP